MAWLLGLGLSKSLVIYKHLIRPIFFSMDPERAHHFALAGLRLASRLPLMPTVLRGLFGFHDPEMAQELWGIRFPNPVGLAAGFDKNSLALPALGNMGFGFVEVGAISSEARPGNPRPRIFRLKEDEALINRMGLPNPGADETARRLASLKHRPVPILANIVKNADLDGAIPVMAADYVKTLTAVFPHVDGFTVNVSCPATPNLKAFNEKDALFELLGVLRQARDDLAEAQGCKKKPLIVKVSPDVTDGERDVLVEAAALALLDGLVLTNTTTQRPKALRTGGDVLEQQGGLSGPPLFPIALAKVKEFAEKTGGQVPIIAVGGISTGEQALQMLNAGASLVEVYTGFVYHGPTLPKTIAKSLKNLGWRPKQSS